MKRVSLSIFWTMLLLVGCTTTRTVTIRTEPADAILRIDGVERSGNPITERFTFEAEGQTHRVIAFKKGFKEEIRDITADSGGDLLLRLQPQTRKITIRVIPAPAIVRLDGYKLSDERVRQIQEEVEMGYDAKDNPVVHTLRAERPDFQPAEMKISRLDNTLQYTLELKPLEKRISVTTNPPGAVVSLDDADIGVSPLNDVPVPFPVDLSNDQFIPRKLKASKEGYLDGETVIQFEDDTDSYALNLGVKQKPVRFLTDPPDAAVTIDGKPMTRSNPLSSTMLEFPPVDDLGTLKTYKVQISKQTETREWKPQEITVGWDEGQLEYKVHLDEVLTTMVRMIAPVMKRSPDGAWEVGVETSEVLAMKDPSDGPDRPAPQPILKLPKGSQLGSIALAPDGSKIVYTVLSGTDAADLRSQIFTVVTDGSAATERITDGRSLDLMPTFTPGGDEIVFSSNRSSRRLSIHSIPASGAGGIARLTAGESNDLWPSVDSDPRPRVFYQAMVDTRADPRLFVSQRNTYFQKDLLPSFSGTQPRVSPKNDAILFASVNDRTGKRDIYQVSDRGGAPVNLTDTADADETDASWSRDGSRVAFATDRHHDDQGKPQYDIWILDLAKPNEPVQITASGSRDDCPILDLTGTSIYFRSNRGGVWGIWKMPVK
jgi:Tol biopolymer transport system component